MKKVVVRRAGRDKPYAGIMFTEDAAGGAQLELITSEGCSDELEQTVQACYATLIEQLQLQGVVRPAPARRPRAKT